MSRARNYEKHNAVGRMIELQRAERSAVFAASRHEQRFLKTNAADTAARMARIEAHPEFRHPTWWEGAKAEVAAGRVSRGLCVTLGKLDIALRLTVLSDHERARNEARKRLRKGRAAAAGCTKTSFSEGLARYEQAVASRPLKPPGVKP